MANHNAVRGTVEVGVVMTVSAALPFIALYFA